MDDRVLQSIRRHLQQPETQQRIQGHIQRVSAQLTVTIGEVAQLFDFTENQLRDWEERGLLRPQRSKLSSGQRRYPPGELEKLAIIRDLIDAGYPPGAIPLNVDSFWHALQQPVAEAGPTGECNSSAASPVPLDRHVAQTDSSGFWRYFASQALHHTLLLLCDGAPRTSAALLLPRSSQAGLNYAYQPEHLAEIGEALVGWLSQGRAFHLFLEDAPSFEYPSDFRIQPLLAEDELQPGDRTLIIVPRQTRALNLNRTLVTTVRRLLEPLYAHAAEWPLYFGPDLRNWLYPARSFPRGIDPEDGILNSLMDLIVSMGGRDGRSGRERWYCSCLLMPEDPALPAAQQALLVQARSRHSPYKPGLTRITPDEGFLYFRALQSRSLLYRRRLSSRDVLDSTPLASRSCGSAVAIPLLDEGGAAFAILYVFSLEPEAFSLEDLRVLRLMARMVEDLLLIYRARLTAMADLEAVIKAPETIDASFNHFLSENDFIREIEDLLAYLQQSDMRTAVQEGSDQPQASPRGEGGQGERLASGVDGLDSPASLRTVAIISLDIDNQSQIVRRYGERALRNLTLLIGLRIQRQLVDCRLYHIAGGRFYLVIYNISLEQARQIALTLRQGLHRSYRVELLQTSQRQWEPPDTGVDLGEVSVRLGVTLYPRAKLVELLQRYAFVPTSPIAEVRSLMVSDLDQALDLGQEEGGNVVISWDPQVEDRGPHIRRFIPLDATRPGGP